MRSTGATEPEEPGEQLKFRTFLGRVNSLNFVGAEASEILTTGPGQCHSCGCHLRVAAQGLTTKRLQSPHDDPGLQLLLWGRPKPQMCGAYGACTSDPLKIVVSRKSPTITAHHPSLFNRVLSSLSYFISSGSQVFSTFPRFMFHGNNLQVWNSCRRRALFAVHLNQWTRVDKTYQAFKSQLSHRG